ncbi:hypothetical protein NQ176_g6005 [Zarea fungicola]|uniref:Uncharacterized protein n=1 Tax=Zarea fungicola TaxID=93591 RepID=A0ACC1N7W0_9HYPO|nr:hypothetical protein NQ176_g6005 [Lecanicillium fungicola]
MYSDYEPTVILSAELGPLHLPSSTARHSAQPVAILGGGASGTFQRESDIFSRWSYIGYYIMVVRKTGLPTGFTWLKANSSTETYSISQLPGVSEIFQSSVPGLFYAWLRSPTDLSRADVENCTIETIRGFHTAQNLPATTPEIVEFNSHTPYRLSGWADDICGGFYNRLWSSRISAHLVHGSCHGVL